MRGAAPSSDCGNSLRWPALRGPDSFSRAPRGALALWNRFHLPSVADKSTDRCQCNRSSQTAIQFIVADVGTEPFRNDKALQTACTVDVTTVGTEPFSVDVATQTASDATVKADASTMPFVQDVGVQTGQVITRDACCGTDDTTSDIGVQTSSCFKLLETGIQTDPCSVSCYHSLSYNSSFS